VRPFPLGSYLLWTAPLLRGVDNLDCLHIRNKTRLSACRHQVYKL
jgi:hypothetical protein